MLLFMRRRFLFASVLFRFDFSISLRSWSELVVVCTYHIDSIVNSFQSIDLVSSDGRFVMLFFRFFLNV